MGDNENGTDPWEVLGVILTIVSIVIAGVVGYSYFSGSPVTIGGITVLPSSNYNSLSSNTNGQSAETTSKTVTQTSVSTQTSISTVTTTSVSTVTTSSIPPNFTLKGSITHYQGIYPQFISFVSGKRSYNFTVSADTYQANIPNSLPYTVILYWEYPQGAGGLKTSGCGSFNQTVAWGSSTITMNWNC